VQQLDVCSHLSTSKRLATWRILSAEVQQFRGRGVLGLVEHMPILHHRMPLVLSDLVGISIRLCLGALH
jgi:hypothetical protein